MIIKEVLSYSFLKKFYHFCFRNSHCAQVPLDSPKVMFLSLPVEFVLALLTNGLKLLLLLSAGAWVYVKVFRKARQIQLHKSLLTPGNVLPLSPTLLFLPLTPTAFQLELELSFFFSNPRFGVKIYV